ncbi:two-component system, NtrC family, response regulator HydG [Carboxydocella sporoproducens DSM 16521]|uniref:Stage 0 sporulation protein A homolog n=2 Tax=Carboxydocella TaxID=178898 RepID=A0A1T4NSC4_9FIRM|nr:MULTISPECIES: sigma-54 dependent transcriptional regulator [Carboxydocella]AVX20208.1 two-component system, NtrC family, response regulator [Carboxydocella thermautotrophica]AVX30626.1 two-component system, NtrC family, response regulator [Carboxydocella thermautotrophica]SJZ82082.1 two-component system, NtrC family, response regulator HydG [Carboxydocella sporoproducens DSM 16521]
MKKILVIDDEKSVRLMLGGMLKKLGFETEAAENAERAFALWRQQHFDAVFCDLRLPDKNGIEVVRELRAQGFDGALLVITAYGTIETAVQAIQAGADDFLTKPLSGPEQLQTVLNKALERRKLLRRVQAEKYRDGVPEFIGVDPLSRNLLEKIKVVAQVDTTVLLTGETGTGKEVVARLLHAFSQRRDEPFLAVNCAALTESLLESQLFGHEKGAFTGAQQSYPGLLRLADGGTLFLDEIGELPLSLQAKLLRVLQERVVMPVGGVKEIRIDVRLVAATNRDLAQEVAAGRFRADLYYRLNVVQLTIPPLRERKGDILPLLQHFCARQAAKLGKPKPEFDEELEARALAYSWPGNVRELANVAERSMLFWDGRQETFDLDLPVLPETGESEVNLYRLERKAIERALVLAGGNRKKAAALLGISLRTLYYKMQNYCIK